MSDEETKIWGKSELWETIFEYDEADKKYKFKEEYTDDKLKTEELFTLLDHYYALYNYVIQTEERYKEGLRQGQMRRIRKGPGVIEGIVKFYDRQKRINIDIDFIYDVYFSFLSEEAKGVVSRELERHEGLIIEEKKGDSPDRHDSDILIRDLYDFKIRKIKDGLKKRKEKKYSETKLIEEQGNKVEERMSILIDKFTFMEEIFNDGYITLDDAAPYQRLAFAKALISPNSPVNNLDIDVLTRIFESNLSGGGDTKKKKKSKRRRTKRRRTKRNKKSKRRRTKRKKKSKRR